MERSFPMPNLFASRCLGFESCRYNGLIIHDEFVGRLASYAHFIHTCPEMEIGLGVPRDPVRIIESKGKRLLYQPATGKDHAAAMVRFTEECLEALAAREIDGFILKGRSPSCGIKDVKVYPSDVPDRAPITGRGAGFFGAGVMRHFPDIPVEDEGRLHDAGIRDHFLTSIYALASFRAVKKEGTMAALVRYQSENKLLLMCYNQKAMRSMGKIVANHEKLTPATVFALYEKELKNALIKAPRPASAINVFQHALGYFSKGLSAAEKRFFLNTLDRYREESEPLSTPVALMKSWIARFGEEYLSTQTFFDPYPRGLADRVSPGGEIKRRRK